VRWFLRNLSQAQWDEYTALRVALSPQDGQEAAGETDEAEVTRKVFSSLRIIVAGWSGVVDAAGERIPFDPARLEEALTLGEAWELYWAGITRLELSGDDRKNSGSRRPSASAASVGPAAAASGASTSPA
jgi:hypothetical protein